MNYGRIIFYFCEMVALVGMAGDYADCLIGNN